MRSSLILWFSFLSIALFGQTAIQGKVKDSDSEVPIEKVKLEIFKNGIKMETTYTDEYGNFSFSNIDPGVYSMKIANKKYYPKRFEKIIAFASQTIKIDLTMEEQEATFWRCDLDITRPKVPLIPYDQCTSGMVLTADQIRVRTNY